MDLKKFDSRPVAIEISDIIVENESTKTYIFKYPLGSRPGQFIMLWLPGLDEKPFSVAYDDGQEFWLTICEVGETSKALGQMKVGDKVGIRGPMGTWYEFEEGQRIATVAGGYGAAPMYFVAREAFKKNCKVEFFVGAREEGLLLYREKIMGLGSSVDLHLSTDDGSQGFKGFVTQLLDQFLEKEKVDWVFACGPEIMMKAAAEVADKHGTQCQLSLEKYMKCGIGVCGQCSIDDTGDLACIKGPVMKYDYLKGLPEFGKYHRDAQGVKKEF